MTSRPAANATEFLSALRASAPGDEITLTGEVYRAKPTSIRIAAPGVTVKAEGAGRLSGWTPFTDCEGITFDGVGVHDPAGTVAAKLTRCKRVTFVRCPFTSAADRLGTGIQTDACEDILIEGSSFVGLRNAATFSSSLRCTARRNELRGLGSDGFVIVQSHDVTITGNLITGFKVLNTSIHPDAVQARCTIAEKIRNLTITDNIITRGDGHPVQGIFCQQGVAGGGYENITITGNVLLGCNGHGIAVYTGASGLIEDNLALGFEGSPAPPRVLCTGCGPDLVVGANTAHEVVLSGATDGGGNIERGPIKATEADAFLASWLKRNDAPADPRDAEIAKLKAELATLKSEMATDLDAARAREEALRGEVGALREWEVAVRAAVG